MTHRLTMANTCLHISAALYLALGFGMGPLLTWLDEGEGELPAFLGTFLLVFCLILAGGIEVVAHGIRRRKFWAWVAGLCIFGLYLPSLFLPLGALGLWGLLDAGSRAEFGVGPAPGGR